MPLSEVERFITELRFALAVRASWKLRAARPGDILTSIDESLAAGDRDEAVWRAFLANQFGRASQSDDEPDSAFEVLCAFGSNATWTFETVLKDPRAFARWVSGAERRVHGLHFGNHRQRYSYPYTPEQLWSTVSSFLDASARSPAEWIETGPETHTREERFEVLYRRFLRINDWARLAAYDFGELLRNVELADVEPGKCYLVGSTGPLKAARRIWPGRPPRVLELLAVQLANDLGVPPSVLEDALCNWQKPR